MPHSPTSDNNNDNDNSDVLPLGIVNVPVEVFTCGGYRYSKLDDALAEARRQHSSANPSREDTATDEPGIVRAMVDCFHFGEYRYSRIDDAIAQAERTLDRTK